MAQPKENQESEPVEFYYDSKDFTVGARFIAFAYKDQDGQSQEKFETFLKTKAQTILPTIAGFRRIHYLTDDANAFYGCQIFDTKDDAQNFVTNRRDKFLTQFTEMGIVEGKTALEDILGNGFCMFQKADNDKENDINENKAIRFVAYNIKTGSEEKLTNMLLQMKPKMQAIPGL